MASTATATAEQTAVRLQYVIDSWPHLVDMLTTRHNATWPPAMGIRHVLDGRDDDPEADRALADALFARTAERADSCYTLGASPAPVRLQVVDVMRTVEADLVYLADTLAQEVQRPVMRKAPSHWLPADRELRGRLVAKDAADPRRWRYREQRSAVCATGWLLARVKQRPGPFLPLGRSHVHRVAAVVGTAHDRIQQALGGARTAQVVDRPCPLCGGTLGMSSGDGGTPLVVCFKCSQEWTLPATA
jgi:hypothetical protein